MRFLSATSKLAFIGTQYACHRQQGLTPTMMKSLQFASSSSSQTPSFHPVQQHRTTRLFSSSGGGAPKGPTLQNIGKEEMEEIVEDYEQGGREDSGYVVIDVREMHEIEFTGKVSPNTLSLPLQKLMQLNVFELDEDEFEEICGFDKPTPDETLVFSCAAGIRSVHAAQFAAQSGYTKLVNYKGGANQWFS
jgi:rhodanese-related sulfurtransferase